MNANLLRSTIHKSAIGKSQISMGDDNLYNPRKLFRPTEI
jgi:hypothetical protein